MSNFCLTAWSAQFYSRSLVSAFAILLPCFCANLAEAVTRYVDVKGGANLYPFTNWTMAANDLQSAIDSAQAGDVLVVSNGVFNSGVRNVPSPSGGVNTRIFIDKAITVQSVNGPYSTEIWGGTGVRAVYVTTNATLDGFKITKGHLIVGGNEDEVGAGIFVAGLGLVKNCIITSNAHLYGQAKGGGGAGAGTYINCQISENFAYREGGGVLGGVVVNSVISNNTSGFQGGGAAGSKLLNCIVANNIASNYGGGGIFCQFSHCTVVNNYSPSGGGVYSGSVTNSIVYFNSPQNHMLASFYKSCTLPNPFGNGNFGDDPLFVPGTFYLTRESPCVDVADIPITPQFDFLGVYRDVPDLGAIEFVGEGGFLSGYDLPTAPSVVLTNLTLYPSAQQLEFTFFYTNGPSNIHIYGCACSDVPELGDALPQSIVPMVSLVSNTSENLGSNISPTATPRRVIWDLGADAQRSLVDHKILLFAATSDDLLLQSHFVSAPGVLSTGVSIISRFQAASISNEIASAIFFAACRGWLTNQIGSFYAADGIYSGNLVYADGAVSAQGPSWISSKIGPNIKASSPSENLLIQMGYADQIAVGRPSFDVYFGLYSQKIFNDLGVEVSSTGSWYFATP